MEHELRQFIRLVFEEQARVPTQLIGVDEEQKESQDDIDEFSGVAAIAGYSGPLGMDPKQLSSLFPASRGVSQLGRRDNKKRKA